jgi:transmembrane sensor
MTDPTDGDAVHEAQARAWLVRLRSGDATSEDVEAFRRWCAEDPGHVRMVRALSDVWSSLDAAMSEVAQQDPQKARRWQDAAAAAAPVRVLRPGRRAFVGFALAAGASWLAIRPPLQLWPALGDYMADYRTGTGEQRQVKLSDRVLVEMNTQTRVNILHTAGTQHSIDLVAGEAEIVAAPLAVGRGDALRPVVVTAGRGRVQAEIARFDVRYVGEQVCVTCLAGSVRVEHPRGSLTLQAAQQVVYGNGEAAPVATTIDPGVVTAWRRGILVFKGTPLAQVVDEINRYRPGKVILRNAALGENRVDAQLPIAELNDAVSLLGKAYGAHVTRLPGDIALLS